MSTSLSHPDFCKAQTTRRVRKRTSCNNFVNKELASCVRTACPTLLEQVENELATTCNKLDGTLKLVTTLLQLLR